ncbi:hypothetical protein [Streptomyces sp. NPDC056056]|uniref:hypothetical protein n=1 Tax=Streptomyces sp. NPDC056056 TaxID=3345698 RepID=UPI0035D9CF0B
MALDIRATRSAYRDRLIERARAAGYRLPPLEAPPADPAVAEHIEIAMCRASLGRKAGPRQGAS